MRTTRFADIRPKATTRPRGSENTSVTTNICTLVSIPPMSWIRICSTVIFPIIIYRLFHPLKRSPMPGRFLPVPDRFHPAIAEALLKSRGPGPAPQRGENRCTVKHAAAFGI